jgi:tRNA threonylcarbamoyl adenosine modification protein (Sua5/YciO/YrdC/YwlC family)
MVPKLLSSNKKTVGIRVPDNNIARCIVKELGNPILSTSIKDEDEIIEYSTDPELIYEKYQDQVDMVIDGGYGGNVASTVVDCTNGEFEVIREGKGYPIANRPRYPYLRPLVACWFPRASTRLSTYILPPVTAGASLWLQILLL